MQLRFKTYPAKTLMLLCRELGVAALLGFILCCAMPAYAFAYVDPSVMTYTIQAIAGAAVALSAVLGVVFRRSRRLIFKLFRIDENAGKEVEPPVLVVSNADDLLERADASARQMKKNLSKGRQPRRLKWGTRLLRSVILSIFFIMTVFTVPMIEIVRGGSASLNFSLTDAWPVVLYASGIVAAALALVLSFFRGRAFDILCALITALGFACYIQALFLNKGLPTADGTILDLGSYKTITVISGAIWLTILVVFVVLAIKRVSIARGLSLTVGCCLLIVQGAVLVSLNPTINNEHDLSEIQFNGLITQEGLYELGSQDNVVVIVLDTYDTTILKDTVEKHPDILDDFTGFTWFQNATSAMTPTRYGIPYLLSGVAPEASDTYYSYLNRRYADSAFIPTIKEAGYDVRVYTDSVLTDRLTPYVDNFYWVDRLPVNEKALLMSLTKAALYRDAPWIAKPLFWFYTDEINTNSLQNDLDPYVIDDPAVYQGLKQAGLSIAPDTPKAFRFIHMLGAHKPLSMDEHGNRGTSDTLEWDQQWVGIINFVSDYLNEMKRLGVYDDATIIVTADHGYFGWEDGPTKLPSSAMLMVKPKETPEEAKAPLKISHAPTGAMDYAATVIDAIGEDAQEYGSTVWEIPEGASRDRYFWHTSHTDHIDHEWYRYDINGDVLDLDNWKLTGETIPIEVHD